jgi:hypothetical protein
MKSNTPQVNATADAPRMLVDPYEAFLSKLSRKSLASVEAHVEASAAQAELGYGRQWKRLAAMLAKLAGHAIEASGQHVLRFYIADGKYKQQVFTLDDPRKGKIQVYLPDVLELAVERRLLEAPGEGEHGYAVVGEPGLRLEIERVTSESKEVPEFVKAMLGWGRRALRVTIAAVGDDARAQAVGRLAELAAEGWPKAEAASAPAAPS